MSRLVRRVAMHNAGRRFVISTMLATLVVGLCLAANTALAKTSDQLALEDMPRQQSWFAWFVSSLGLIGLLTLVAAAAVFIGACVVAVLTRRPAVLASYLVFLLLPPWLGALGAILSLLSSFSILARTDVQIQASEFASGISSALLIPWLALAATLPSFILVAICLFVRTLQADRGATSAARAALPASRLSAGAPRPQGTN